MWTIAAKKQSPPSNHGPVYRPSPNHTSPARWAGLISNGPTTAPNVEAKTTWLIALARWSGSARSVAA